MACVVDSWLHAIVFSDSYAGRLFLLLKRRQMIKERGRQAVCICVSRGDACRSGCGFMQNVSGIVFSPVASYLSFAVDDEAEGRHNV